MNWSMLWSTKQHMIAQMNSYKICMIYCEILGHNTQIRWKQSCWLLGWYIYHAKNNGRYEVHIYLDENENDSNKWSSVWILGSTCIHHQEWSTCCWLYQENANVGSNKIPIQSIWFFIQ